MARVRRHGPVGFDDFVDEALYGPGGFYASGGGAGRGRDFLTSPEVGPLYGAVVARALDGWWDGLGRPDPFVVVEAGAGPGTLARDVLAAGPACAPALRYLLVERSEALRRHHAEALPLEPLASVIEPPPGEAEEVPSRTGVGPLVASAAELPAEPVGGVVLANELLDNLAFSLFERTAAGWAEVRVGEVDGRLSEVLVPAPAPFPLEAPEGARVPVQRRAGEWLRRALGTLRRGRVVVVDYADATESLAARPWPEWLRTYRAGGRGGHPLDHPGDQDVTCEVAVDQLARVRPPDLDRPQADFLAASGLDALVAEARATWAERAARPDLVALKARSRVGEAAALRDPGGLGAFRVLEWVVGSPGASRTRRGPGRPGDEP